MRRLLAIAGTGLTSVALHPTRSAATAVALVAVLAPYLAGLAISHGVREQADAAVRSGADLYVSGEQFGRPVPLPQSAADNIKKLPGVRGATARIVGRIELGRERVGAVILGIPIENLPAELKCIDGRLYRGGARNELVVGSDLARRLNLRVGSLLPPFYHSHSGEHVSEVVGVFRSEVSPWQARLIVTSFETAARIFDQPGLCTDVVVYCDTGYQDRVRTAIVRDLSVGPRDYGPRARVTTREEAADVLAEGPARREGALTLMSVIAFGVAILAVLVTSGFGVADRRREIGILRATGWQIDEVLLRSLTESLVLGVGAASASVVIAYLWLAVFNGYGIAAVLFPGVDPCPGFRVPFRLLPVPVLVTVLIALVIVTSGSLYSTWRTAVSPPSEQTR
jgi:ABC-type lipoprotein release transport system permease subunit